MEYIIWFDVSAIFILAIILITLYIKYRIPLVQYRLFRILLWTALISSTADLFAGMWGNNLKMATELFPIGVCDTIHVVYLVARNALPAVLLLYVLSIINIKEKNMKGILMLLVPMGMIELLILTSPVTDLVFYVDEAGIYHRGNGMFLLYIVAFAYMVVTFALVVAFRKLFSRQQYRMLILFEIIVIFMVLIQWAYPAMLVEGFGIACGVLGCCLTIQRPEEVLDGSTGFYNKKMFSNLCSLKLVQKQDFQVLLIILDDYDFLEKSYGINAVSGLMVDVANYLRTFSGQICCRISEDKFCLVGEYRESGKQEEILEAIKERFLKPWKYSEYNTVLQESSCLIKCPEDAASIRELMELIDVVAGLKKEDRKKINSPKEINLEKIQRRNKIEMLVKEAVERNVLEVVYQPIYSPKEKRFCSAEALLRMRDNEMGNISPAEFIPIAEKTGAIVKIGKYVLDTVCRFTSQNDLRKYGIEYVEINLSPVECLQEDLSENVLKNIYRHGLNPRQINLEITETAISYLPESIEEKMSLLLTEGVTFSLDDYGTGYSNLSRLAALPLDIIKIDKSIVQDAFHSENMKVILDSTLRMVSMLNKKVLAEGVEKKEEAEYLIDRGCDYIQGYYYAKPMSGTEFLHFLEEQIRKQMQMEE